MGRRLSKKMIIEKVITMDMDTYKKNKGSLSDDDKVHIVDKQSMIEEEDDNLEEKKDESKL